MDLPFHLTPEERQSFDENGFLVRHGVFTRDECRAMADAVEQLQVDLLSAKRRTKVSLGSYMFELQREMQSIVKWEPQHPDVVQGVEPFAHISPSLDGWARDLRLWNPARDIVGQDDLGLFTEKITMKRARTGGTIILHQDYPYWRGNNAVAHRVMTAMIQIDDADRQNGCLEVLPGSHRDGWNKTLKEAVDGFGGNELDDSKFDLSALVPVESQAGSVIFFGAFLIHRSLPNTSNRDRRALLFSYQPGGYPTSLELNRAMMAPRPKPEAVA